MVMTFAPVQATYDALIKRLDEMGKGGEMDAAMIKAVNDAAKEVKKMTHAATMERYTIQPELYTEKDLKKRASGREPLATIKVKGNPVNVWKGYLAQSNSGKNAAGTMILKNGALKPVEFKAKNRTYKAFLATMGNGHEGIFLRNPQKAMKTDKRPEPTKRNPKKKRKPKEALRQVIALSRSKAVEMAFRGSVEQDVMAELNYELLKHVNAVLGGEG